MIKYSLIIPHFNDCERLERLLKTIPVNRPDIEVLIVDDCSPDQSALDKIRESLPQISWLSTPENAGAGVARNVGLDSAKGLWLLFADSDDEFLPGAFDTFDNVLRAGDELVYFLAKATQEIDGLPSVRSERTNDLVTNYFSTPTKNLLLQLQLHHVVPWAKVYARSFIEEKKLRFDPVRHGEDVSFNVLAAIQAHSIRVELISVYRVYLRAGSLTMNSSQEDLIARLEVLGNLNDRFRDLGVSERMHAASYIVRAVRFGPLIWGKVFYLMIRHEMLAATLARLSPREIWRYIRRSYQSRAEHKKLRLARSKLVKKRDNRLIDRGRR